jgi:uncharacterized protein YbjT (DUF2867 family)
MTLNFVSGAGTDETGTSRLMCARVNGRAENAVRALPFRRANMFRPGLLQPRHGITSRTALYRNVLSLLKPVMLLRGLSGSIVSTEDVGRAMITVARIGYDKPILEARA